MKVLKSDRNWVAFLFGSKLLTYLKELDHELADMHDDELTNLFNGLDIESPLASLYTSSFNYIYMIYLLFYVNIIN